MTLEDLVRRLGTVLTMCGVCMLLVALVVAVTGARDQPEVVTTLHHLFGLALAVLGGLLVIVGIALEGLVSSSKRASMRANRDQQEHASEAVD